jgi:hypothetical protein
MATDTDLPHAAPPPAEAVETSIPSRLDRLPWSRWHWMVLLGYLMGTDASRVDEEQPVSKWTVHLVRGRHCSLGRVRSPCIPKQVDPWP